MNDPYDAIRIISERSLRSIGQWHDFGYDFLDSPPQRNAKIAKQLDELQIPSQAGKSTLLLDDQGSLSMPRLGELLKQRNQRVVELFE
jgi:hypothetical protein